MSDAEHGDSDAGHHGRIGVGDWTMTRRRYATITLGAAALACILPTAARADERPFNPTIEWRPSEFPWESGYVPADGPLRVNLGAAVFHEVLIGMQGQAQYDWDATTLEYRGTADSGLFRNTLGAEITATIAVDALGFMQEFEVGVWDIAENAEADFTPYLLPGNPERPVVVAEMIGPFQLANEPFAVGPVTGTLTIDFAFDIPGISFEGNHIALDDAEGPGGAPIAGHEAEGEVVGAILPDAPPGELSISYATMHGSFDSAAALHLYPTVEIDLGGVPFAIGPFDLVVDYPVISDAPVVFPELPLMFEVPAVPDTTGSTGGADTSGGVDPTDGASVSAGDESTTSTTSEGATTGDGVDTVPADLGEDVGSGCGCRASRRAEFLPWLVVLVAAPRRRRRSPAAG